MPDMDPRYAEWLLKEVPIGDVVLIIGGLRKEIEETGQPDPLLDIATGYNRALDDVMRRLIIGNQL